MARPAGQRLPSTPQHGVVVKFDAEKGFGFIRPQDAPAGGQDVFVHVRNVTGHRVLYPGQNVTFFVTRTDKGLAALKVQAGSPLATPYLKFTVVGFGSALLLLLGLGTALGTRQSLGVWIGLWIVAVSIASFGIYGYDKAQAQNDNSRVPEGVLHALSLLGGSPGCLAAMRIFRHKTRKPGFQVVFWLIVAAQTAAILLWALEK